MKNSDKPIYPHLESSCNEQNQIDEIWVTSGKEGLTKREYFAGVALQGLVANLHNNSPKFIAEVAVKIADELLKELEK